ncbi:P-loop containing nucleoside triphosphate hydrolase protein [Haematococcus lacustris]
MDVPDHELGSRRPPMQWTALAGPHIERHTAKLRRRQDLTQKSTAVVKEHGESGAVADEEKRESVPQDSSLPYADQSLRRRDEQRVLTQQARSNRHRLKAINIAAALQQKLEPIDPSCTWLPAENEAGPLEYKLQLRNPHPIRLQQLITQMKYRLSEGSGECHYYLGVEDDGYPKGLTSRDLHASIATLHAMATPLQAHVSVVRFFPGAHGRQYVLMKVQQGVLDEATYDDVRVAVLGSVDSGKSTLVAVLTQGSAGQPALDSGRGTARMVVLRHKHEIESGRTSSLSQQLLGYTADGKVLNYSALPSPSDVCSAAAKVLTLVDMGGHQRCLKTTLYGMTALLPDFVVLCCCGLSGLGSMGREHLAVATALDLPVIVVITKVDAVDAQQLQAVVREIQTLHRAAAPPQLSVVPECESAPWVTSQQQAEEIGAHLNHWLRDTVQQRQQQQQQQELLHQPLLHQGNQTTITTSQSAGNEGCRPPSQRCLLPILSVSTVTGSGLNLLHALLNSLHPARICLSTPPAAGAGARPAAGLTKVVPGQDLKLPAEHSRTQQQATPTGQPQAGFDMYVNGQDDAHPLTWVQILRPSKVTLPMLFSRWTGASKSMAWGR